MVKLKRLVLRNFKSFKKAEIPISRGFTCIVGGNGCGKTNILDALLFVMGITSLKALRAGKLTELVNNNTVENYAKVELTLGDGDNNYTIQRMIDKQGKCVYRLDGQRKTLGEISSLLLELGLRPDGHNIVAQGDVTRVIEMNPEQRRQIIDETAGLQEFDEKKEEALKNLDKVDVKLRNANIVLQERENYLAELQEEKKAAVLFKQLQEERKRAKATVLTCEIWKINKSLREGGKRISGLGSEREAEQQQAEQAAAEAEKLKAESNKLGEEMLGSSENTYATVGARLEEAKAEKSQLLERIERKQELVARNNRRLEENKGGVAGIEAEVRAEEQRIAQICSELPGLRNELQSVEEKKALLEKRLKKSEQSLQERNAAEERLSLLLAELNERRTKAVSALNVLQNEMAMKKELLQQLLLEQEQLAAKLDERDKSRQLLNTLHRQFENPARQLSATEKQNISCLDELKAVEAEKRGLAESIAVLGKSVAICPVCESELRKQRKEDLLKRKQSALKGLAAREAELGARKAQLQKKEKELRETVEKEKELVFQLRDSGELKERSAACRKKTGEIKAFLGENSVEKKSGEIGAIEAEIKGQKAEMDRIAGQRRQFTEGAALEQFRHASNKALELRQRLHELEQEKQAIAGKAIGQLQKQKQSMLSEIEALKTENKETVAEIEETKEELQKTGVRIDELEKEMADAEKRNKKTAEKKKQLDAKIEKLGSEEKSHGQKLRTLEQEENALRIEKSRQEVRLADIQEEASQFEGVGTIEKFTPKQLGDRIAEIDKKIQQMGAINMRAIESFDQLAAEVQDVRKKVEQLERERQAVLQMIEKIDLRRKNIFMRCFEALNKNFSSLFFRLFSGEGRLSLSDPQQPLDSGLLIEAKHKGESIQNIDSMSGGEKTLTALAFLFAIQLYEPAPFYVFDEADAALDKENSMKMVKIIKDVSRQSQFIAITHNDPLIQKADQIIGVTLNKQRSSVIGLKLREKIAAEEAIAKQPVVS